MFDEVLEQEDIADIMELGLKEATGTVFVSPLGTLVSTWALSNMNKGHAPRGRGQIQDLPLH